MTSFYTTYKYDKLKYPFREVLCEMLGVETLELIHEHTSWPLLTRSKDQSTPYHKLYYSQYSETLSALWESFVKEVVSPIFKEDVYYQSIPTFRIQIPGNVGVGEFHKDSDYGHTDGALNIFLPMVDLTEHNTIWAESSPGKGDYSPIHINYGEFALWDGVNLKHGNKPNPSNLTRVSVDARFLAKSKYNEKTAKSSINLKVKFGPGGYFSEQAI